LLYLHGIKCLLLSLLCLDDVYNGCDNYVIGVAGDVVRLRDVQGVAALNAVRPDVTVTVVGAELMPSATAARIAITAPAIATEQDGAVIWSL
jgi:hypothetical protein